MSMPNIPTDSLYKFIAITGLIILFFSIAAPFYIHHHARINMININGEIKLLKIDIDLSKQNIGELENKLKERKLKGHKKHSSSFQKDVNIASLFDKTIKVNRTNKIRSAKISTKVKLIENYNELSGLITMLFFVGAPLSIIMIYSGFYFWYVRIQKPLDKKISLTKTI